MHILIIGGTRFIGPYVVRELKKAGHRVTVFHRGLSKAEMPADVEHILGDRNHLEDFQDAFKNLNLDVVVDMILITGYQAEMLVTTFKGMIDRIIGISSQDVYRAYGIMLGKEQCDVQATPLREDAALRSTLYPYRGDTPRSNDDPRRILDDYDKIPIEKVLMGTPEIRGCILRLPMVYGPGDYQHRLFEYVKRIDDGRRTIILDQGLAEWRSSFGYVENVAHAISCAVTNDTAVQKIYNVADKGDLTWGEWVKQIGRFAGWNGTVITLAGSMLPPHLDPGFNTKQHLNVSTEYIRADIGYEEIVSIDEALTRTIAWERTHAPGNIDPRQYDYVAEDQALTAYEHTIQ
ncbi:NAD-dependent epimerase/dehydratase family protein [candidate division WOR-3 bacterium]|nr:NAD-dependent epimerase/dehydratase family protein [candidate division WOR-3 bacterium]